MKPVMSEMATIAIGGGVILLIGLAYLVLTYVDVPVRRYLMKKVKRPLI